MSDPMHASVAVAENGSDSPKRPLLDGMDGEPPGKMMRRSTGSSVVVELGRVAEMVMVLSSMGRMRGGRDPTAVEVYMMKEAREMLAELCCSVSKPRDIASGDVVARLIEELGLDYQVKDQRLGFKVPKMSITEKMLLTKRKMEESKKFPSHTTSHAPPSLQACSSPAAENHGTSSVAHVLPLDKLPQNDPRATVISVGVSDNFYSGRDASQMILPKADVVQEKADKASNVFFRPSPANFNVNQPSVNVPSWSLSSQNSSLNRFGPGNNMVKHMSVPNDHVSSTAMSSSAPGSFPAGHQQSMQRANAISASSNFAVHNEIAKLVLQILTPKILETPIWTPPSREYMNKAVICHICQGTIADVESVLLCDACEKGYHLKCLQSYNQRGIPKAEWHCQKCMALSHGKPLPPKYGRVMRNMGVAKAPSSAAGVQLQTDRKLGTSDAKVNSMRILSNEVNLPQNNNISDDHSGSSSNLQSAKDGEAQQNSLSFEKGLDLKQSSDTAVINQMMSADAACRSIDTMAGSSQDDKREEHDSDKCPDSNSSIGIKPDIQKNEQLDYVLKQSVDELQSVKWIGEPLDSSIGKTFYNSCSVGGVIYKLGRHALFHSNNDKVAPFKLQSMWEDTVLGLTYVKVTRCYFPEDLPNNICHPFTSDNEVFESDHSSILLAGSIKGPCEVLSPAKYKEESEKLSHWNDEDNKKRVPLFLCSWFYDKLKGHFQAFSI